MNTPVSLSQRWSKSPPAAGPEAAMDARCLSAVTATVEALAARGLDRARTLDLVATRAAEALEADTAIISLLDARGEWLERAACHNLEPGFAGQIQWLRFEGSVAADALAGGRAVALEDLGEPDSDHLRSLRRYGVQSMMILPIMPKSGPIGTLHLFFRRPRRFTAQDEAGAMAFAHCGAIAIEDAYLRDRADQRLTEMETLLSIGRMVGAAPGATEVGRRALREMVRLLGADIGGAWLLDPGTPRFVPFAGYHVPAAIQAAREDAAFDTGHPLVRELLRRRCPLCSTHSADDPWLRHPVLAELGHQSVAAVPLVAHDDVVGFFLLLWVGRARHFSNDDVRLLEGLSRLAMVTIDHARLHEETEHRRREAEVLTEVVRAINDSLNLDTVLQRVTDAARELCEADAARIALRDPDEDAMMFRYCAGTAQERYADVRIRPGKGLGGNAMLTGTPHRTSRYADELGFSKDYLGLVRGEGSVCIMAVPVCEGPTVEGLIYVSRRSPRPFTDSDEQVLVRLAAHAAVAIHNARLYAGSEVRRLAAESLAEAGQLLSRSLDPTEVAQRVVESVFRLFSAAKATLHQADEPTGRLRPIAALAGASSSFRGPAADVAMQERRAIVTADVLDVPLLTHGRALGVLTLQVGTGRAFTPDEVRVAQAFADQAAIALENARLYGTLAANQDELQRTNLALAETLKVQSEFLANTTHELRTPLCGIMSLLTAVVDGVCESDEESAHFVVQARANAAELLDLITNILDMARLEAGRLAVAVEPVDVATLFDEVAALVAAVAMRNGDVRLAFEPPAPTAQFVQADPLRLRQVLVNVVGNSLKFTPEGEILVRADADRAAGLTTIEVADTGIGIAREHQAHLFEKFVQADGSTSRKYGGTGLGLAICKRLVDLMGGAIALESDGEGRGTRVRVSLPTCDSSRPPLSAGAELVS